MDVQMPVMDGLEATRQIRAREGSVRRTPIIAITANALPEQRAEGLQAGMDVYLSKPIQIDQLVAVLEKVCRQAESFT
jgi:two-component system sensor histidine kinase BarA